LTIYSSSILKIKNVYQNYKFFSYFSTIAEVITADKAPEDAPERKSGFLNEFDPPNDSCYKYFFKKINY
jgi:hypothetical protein